MKQSLQLDIHESKTTKIQNATIHNPELEDTKSESLNSIPIHMKDIHMNMHVDAGPVKPEANQQGFKLITDLLGEKEDF